MAYLIFKDPHPIVQNKWFIKLIKHKDTWQINRGESFKERKNKLVPSSQTKDTKKLTGKA